LAQNPFCKEILKGLIFYLKAPYLFSWPRRKLVPHLGTERGRRFKEKKRNGWKGNIILPSCLVSPDGKDVFP